MNEKQKNYIRSNHKSLPPPELAKRLNVPEKAVQREIQNMGLTKKEGTRAFKTGIYEPYQLTQLDWLLTTLVFLFSLGLYVFTMSPGICAGDSGELTSAVFFLGNAHSPGYPLYCVAGKFFMNILPFLGRAVYRLNFFSAFGGALTVTGAFILILKLLARVLSKEDQELRTKSASSIWLFSRIPALAAALFLLFSDELWAQSTISEVYTLNSMFIPVFLLLLLRWDEMLIQKPAIRETGRFYWNPASKTIYALIFLYAFSLGDHHIMLGVTLPLFFFIIQRYIKGKNLNIIIWSGSLAYFSFLAAFIIGMDSLPAIVSGFTKLVFIGAMATLLVTLLLSDYKIFAIFAVAALFAGLGFLLYVYLPIRGKAYAPLHWGIPTTWERFQNVVLRKQYQGFAQQNPWDFMFSIQQIAIWIKWRIHEFTLPVLLLIIPGIALLHKKDKKWSLFTLSFLLYYDFGLLKFNNFRFTPRDEFFAEVFWIPSYFVTAIWIGFGVLFFVEQTIKYIHSLERSEGEKRLTWISLGLLGLSLAGPALNLVTDKAEFLFTYSWQISLVLLALGGLLFVYINNLKNREANPPSLAPKAVLAGSLLLTLLTFNANFADNNLRHNYANDNYGLNMLSTLDKGAILFTEGGDNQVFSLLYHHLVEHLRPDCRIWDQKGNVFEGLYGDLMRITQKQLTENQLLGDFSQWATGRPIYYTWKDHNRLNTLNQRYYTTPGTKSINYTWKQDGRMVNYNKTWELTKPQAPRTFENTGILYRIVPADQTYVPRIEYWDYYKFDWQRYPKEAVHWDYLAREIIANYNFQLGDRHLKLSDQFRQAASAGKQSFRGVTSRNYAEKIQEHEDLGFKYYLDSTVYGFDMVAIHFNFAIFIEQRAIQYIRQNNIPKALELYDQAIEKYQNAINVDRKEVRAYNNLAAAWQKKANIDPAHELEYLAEARAVYQKVLDKILPNYTPARQGLDQVESRLKFPFTNVQTREAAYRANKRDKAAIDSLLEAYMGRMDIQAATSLLEEVTRNTFPNDWKYLNYLASFYGQMRNIERTLYYLQQLARLQPNNPSVWYQVGEIYFQQKKYDLAEQAYNRVLATGSANPQFGQIVNNAQNKLIQIQSLRPRP